MITLDTQLTVLGQGPAGVAAAVQAYAHGHRRIIGLDDSTHIGSGGLGGMYGPGIMSNSSMDDFVSFLQPLRDNFDIESLINSSPIASYIGREEPAPLPEVATVLEYQARWFIHHWYEVIRENAARVQQTPNGWEVSAAISGRKITSPEVVIATGGSEKYLRFLRDRDPHRTFTSGDVLSGKRARRLNKEIDKGREIIIIGDRDGAYSSGAVIRSNHPDAKITFYKKNVTTLRFGSVDAAHERGYELSPYDVVDEPTGIVNRYNGIGDIGHDLWFEESRNPDSVESRYNAPGEIDKHAVVVQATGFRPNGIDIRRTDGSPLVYEMRPTETGGSEFYEVIPDRDPTDYPLLDGLYGIGIGYSRGIEGLKSFYKQAEDHYALHSVGMNV